MQNTPEHRQQYRILLNTDMRVQNTPDRDREY
jgi:hypothetical protein